MNMELDVHSQSLAMWGELLADLFSEEEIWANQL